MRKKYMSPELDIVELKNKQTLLAGSLNINNTNAGDDGTYYNDAPEMLNDTDFDFE